MIAIGLFSLTACGSKAPSRDEVKAKLKTESDFKTYSDKQVDCLAGVFVKYAKASDLSDYVKGKKTLDAVQGPKNDAQATKDLTGCLTGS